MFSINFAVWIIFFFWQNFFFPFKNFYSNTKKKTFKSNNKNNKYINQLLKLPLLRHTHTPTHTHTHTHTHRHTHTQRKIIIIIIKGNTNLPLPGISCPATTKTETQRQQSRNRSRQLLSQRPPQVAGILDPLHSYVSAT